MIQPGGAERVTGVAAAAWLLPGSVSSRTLPVLQGSQRLRGWLAADLFVGGELGSPGVVFVASGSPYAPSEGNLGVKDCVKKLTRSLSASPGRRRGTRLVSRQTVRAVVARKRMAVEQPSEQPVDMRQNYHIR